MKGVQRRKERHHHLGNRKLKTDVNHRKDENDEVGDDKEKRFDQHAGLAEMVSDLEVLIVLKHKILFLSDDNRSACRVQVGLVNGGLFLFNGERQIEASIPVMRSKYDKESERFCVPACRSSPHVKRTSSLRAE